MRVKVEFEVELPDLGGTMVARADIHDWIAYQLGAIGELKRGNLLAEYDLEAEFGSVDWSEQ